MTDQHPELDNETVTKLLRVMLDGYVIGVASTLRSDSGIADDNTASAAANIRARILARDPVARNVFAERATALFTDNPDLIAKQGAMAFTVPVGCANPDHKHNERQDGASE